MADLINEYQLYQEPSYEGVEEDEEVSVENVQ
jgi:hypothetical protein